jgi:enoyl-CoA hydratase/carnithine racemase
MLPGLMPDTVLLERDGERVATITLNRPERLNTIVPELIEDFLSALREAQADNDVHAVRLKGAGRVFCAGYDIGWGSELMESQPDPWDPILDYQVMTRYVDAYMELWRSPKPVVAQVHRYCVAGGTDFALCSDIIVCDSDCRIGYPPARVWGSPTTSMWVYRLGLERAKRMLLTGDAVDGRTAVDWGLASHHAPLEEVDDLGLGMAERMARLPKNQLHMMKLLVNQSFESMGLRTTQLIGTLLDGSARHTPEGVDFTRRGLEDVGGVVAKRDGPMEDYAQGRRTASDNPGSSRT